MSITKVDIREERVLTIKSPKDISRTAIITTLKRTLRAIINTSLRL